MHRKYVVYINFLLLLINIYYLLKEKIIIDNYNDIKKKKIFKCKNSDYYLLGLMNKKYIEISNYLNNKFSNITNIFINNKYNNTINNYTNKISSIKDKFPFFKKRKIISLCFVDLFDKYIHKNWLKNILGDKFKIKFNNIKPDYLIYDVFGNEHLNPKYNNSIKIAIYTENKIPDFSEADYIIGHSHINYLDRYFKFSMFLWQNLNNDYFNSIRNKTINSDKRTKFCAALISNNISTDGFRINFIEELSKYKKVDMGGQYNNNIGRKIIEKIDFLTSYKFSIAMENSEGDGYISEKIVDSFLAGTIPIYYGDYMIDEYINPKSFILIRSKKDIYEKIEFIKKIDNDENLYRNFLKEKVLLDDNIPNKIDKELKEFLFNIFGQDKSKARRKFE